MAVAIFARMAKIARARELETRCPLVVIAASGVGRAISGGEPELHSNLSKEWP
jgi:hypothetical protein